MLEGKRIAILVEEGFEDSELMEPLRAMKDTGARVVIIGSGSKRRYKGKRGFARITPDTAADKAIYDNFDAVIIPGGCSTERMRHCQPMVELVSRVHDKGKVVAAICHGPQLLVSADIIRGRRVTSSPMVAADMKNAGAIWVDEPVVRNGNIITSRRTVDLPKFNKAIIESLL